MPKLTIKNLKGITMDESLWNQGYSSYAKGVDIYGLADNIEKISYPGVIQSMRGVSGMPEATGVSAVTEEIQDFAFYPHASGDHVYAIGRVNPARIYYNNSGTWTWLSSINTSANGNNLCYYGANLFYAQNGYLGLYDGTNGWSNWQTLATTTPYPMKVFGGSLYIGNEEGLCKYDGTTYTSNKLSLPTGFQVRSLETYNDRLYISADNDICTRIFVWDGVSNTYELAFDLSYESFAPSLIVSENILWLVGNRGLSTNKTSLATPIYVFNGSTFNFVMNLPLTRSNTFAPPNGVAAYKGGIIIGASDGATANYEDGVGGIWYIGKSADNFYYATLAFVPNESSLNCSIAGIYSSGNTVYLGNKDTRSGTDYRIHSIRPNSPCTTSVWQSLPIDAGSTNDKMWNKITVNFEALLTSQTLAVKYRLEGQTSFTTLKTFTASDSVRGQKADILINKTSRSITIRFELGGVKLAISPVQSTRLHGFTIDYTPVE